MNVFTAGYRRQPWIWQVTGLCLILGVLLAGSLQTVRYVHRAGYGSSRIGVPPPRVSSNVTATVDKLKQTLEERVAYIQKLEDSSAKGNDRIKTIADELQKVKLLAGLTAVKGPGIVLTLQDSKKRLPSNRLFEAEKYIIHDVDLQQVVNELGASGAEAVSINGQRIISRTAIRCVGPTIQVNGVAIAPPFEIAAIGDPATLDAGLNMPLGILDNIRRYDPAMQKLERRAELELPAYLGSTETRYAKPELDDESATQEAKR